MRDALAEKFSLLQDELRNLEDQQPQQLEELEAKMLETNREYAYIQKMVDTYKRDVQRRRQLSGKVFQQTIGDNWGDNKSRNKVKHHFDTLNNARGVDMHHIKDVIIELGLGEDNGEAFLFDSQDILNVAKINKEQLENLWYPIHVTWTKENRKHMTKISKASKYDKVQFVKAVQEQEGERVDNDLVVLSHPQQQRNPTDYDQRENGSDAEDPNGSDSD